MELNVSIFVGGVLRGNKRVVTPCLIGRSKECEISVRHPAMSRKHCELYEENGTLFLRDHGSLNGTFYKGEYVGDPIPLRPVDEFNIGELNFRIAPPESLTQEQRDAIANQPTTLIVRDGDSDERLGMATIMETPNNLRQ